MEMQGPSFEKQETVLLKVLKYKATFSFVSSDFLKIESVGVTSVNKII